MTSGNLKSFSMTMSLLIVSRPNVVLRICHEAVCHWMTTSYVKVLFLIYLRALLLSYHVFVLYLYLFCVCNRQSDLLISIKIKNNWIIELQSFFTFVLCILLLSKFFITNWCTRELFWKGVLKFILKLQ